MKLCRRAAALGLLLVGFTFESNRAAPSNKTPAVNKQPVLDVSTIKTRGSGLLGRPD